MNKTISKTLIRNKSQESENALRDALHIDVMKQFSKLLLISSYGNNL